MKIIVTGGRGFIGSYICEKLSALGHEVHTIGRSKGKHSGTCNPKCFHHQYNLIKDTLPEQLLEGSDLFFMLLPRQGFGVNTMTFTNPMSLQPTILFNIARLMISKGLFTQALRA